MVRRKLKKIREADSLPYVISPDCNDNWLTDYFGKIGPVTLEIGCGRGDYTINLAQRYPDRIFIGVDEKGARIWTGAQIAEQTGLSNIGFLRRSALTLTEIFKAGQIEEIWIPFPDPFPKKKKINRRLTSPKFLTIYQKLLSANGRVHLKTDDQAFYDYTLETLQKSTFTVFSNNENIYQNQKQDDVTTIQTKYEQAHLAAGKTIKHICFGP